MSSPVYPFMAPARATLDPDIAEADSLGLQRLYTQAVRDDVRVYAHEIQIKGHEASREAFAQRLLVAMAPAYMKPTTATTPPSMRVDAERDAIYLGEALRAVLLVYDAQFPPPA